MQIYQKKDGCVGIEWEKVYICMRETLKARRMNNHKTYLAFNVDAVRDSKKENLHTLNLLGDWQRRFPNRFNFLNTDYINFIATHDDLVETTVKSDFFARMEKADNLMLVVTKDTDADNVWLNWQISRAVNRFRLPVVVVYADYEKLDDSSIKDYWPYLQGRDRSYRRHPEGILGPHPTEDTQVHRTQQRTHVLYPPDRNKGGEGSGLLQRPLADLSLRQYHDILNGDPPPSPSLYGGE